MAKLHFRPYIPNQTVLFPGRIDENIAANDPVRIVNTVVDNLNLDNFKKLYKATGRCPYHPKMMLKVIIYAYMNNIYSCRKEEERYSIARNLKQLGASEEVIIKATGLSSEEINKL